MSVSRSTASPGAPGQTRRDEAWFDQLYARYKAHVMAYALRRIPTDADDVVACAFAAAWRKRDQAPERALPWLYAAASREVLHVLRSRSRREALGGRLAGHLGAVTPDHSAPADARLDAAVIVGEVLSRLPATDAEVLRLWAWEQLDPHEIALVLGIGPGGGTSPAPPSATPAGSGHPTRPTTGAPRMEAGGFEHHRHPAPATPSGALL